jgi:hypothetical protein
LRSRRIRTNRASPVASYAGRAKHEIGLLDAGLLSERPGSPFGENLRALVIYVRFTQGVAFERLARLLSDIIGLEISEGARVNIGGALTVCARMEGKR